MDPHKNTFTKCFASLHVLHICLSIGLIIAVVHNQLANNARLNSLEEKCALGSNNLGNNKRSQATGDHSIQRKSTMHHTVNSIHNSKDTERQNISASSDSFRSNQTLPKHDNQDSQEQDEIIEPSKDSQKTNSKNMTHKAQTTMNSTLVQNTVNQSEVQQNNGSMKSNRASFLEPTDSALINGSFKTKTTGMGARIEKSDLLYCLDELKLIVDDYLESGHLKRSNGCKLLQGAKGERGEKGCSGTSFASPSFQETSQNLVFNEGDTALLICHAKSNPSAEITWFSNNVLINEEAEANRYTIGREDITHQVTTYCPSEIPHPITQGTLMIRNSNGSDTGSYVCKARNILGTSDYKIDVLIRVHVQFTLIPTNITLVQGENLQMSCRASGVPAPSVTWYRKDGRPMPLYYNLSNGDLHIRNISKREEGTFVCVASNVLGSKTTESTVIVNVFPRITLFPSSAIIVNESQTLNLPCTATGFPVPDIHWSKIKDTLPNHRHSYDSRLLNITSVEYEDRGEFLCTANNTAGSTQRNVKVIVQVRPKIIKRPNATEFGYLSKTKRLIFEVLSFPVATVTWKRPYWDSRMHYGRSRQENGSLIIQNVQYTDSGLYQAVARNILGEVSLTTFLVVRDVIIPPMLTAKPDKEVLSYSKGASISLACKAIGVPIPTVTWVNSSGSEMPSRDSDSKGSRTLKIDSFTSLQRGRYTCTAQNDFGKVETHVYLLITSEIRLAGSSNSYQGRVEIYTNGEWGTVCGKSWSITYANIACKQLGFTAATTAHEHASFGQGHGSVFRLNCNGHENRLQDCGVRKVITRVVYSYGRRRYYNRGSTSSSCKHDRDAGVTCK